MTDQTPHIPVMLSEVLENLAPQKGGIFIDGTFGRGGYTRALLEAGASKVIGIDRDPEAITSGQKLIEDYKGKLELRHGTFGSMEDLLSSEEKAEKFDGITFDLGVSSPQLDQAIRGFSFQSDGPLDMRMSASGETAADIVNNASEKDLADILYKFGDERFSRRIARRIVEKRKEAPITRTKELADLIHQALPPAKDGTHPATRSFQALRIAVNDELGELERGMEAAEKLLKPEGHLVIVSFHSLEDRYVKNFFRTHSGTAPQGSRHMPLQDNQTKKPTFTILTRKPVAPSEEEIDQNPRSRSARLRAAARTDAPIPTENAA